MYSNSAAPEKIDREGIRRVFFNRQKDIRGCYEKGLKEDKELKGIINLAFDINPSGRAIDVSYLKERSTLDNEKVRQCIFKIVAESYFPKPPTSQYVNVIYPLSFNPKASKK